MVDRLNANDEIVLGDELTSADGRSVLAMQGDGNLVLYMQHADGTRTARWATGSTFGLAVSQCVMQGDGNFVIYGYPTSRALWATGTWGHPGAFLIVQDDGNVVIYDGPNALWSTGTAFPTVFHPTLFGPDRLQPSITFERRVMVRPGRTLVAHFNFRSNNESAIMVYGPIATNALITPTVLAERGNHGRDGSAFHFTNDASETVDVVFSGWYKDGPPSGARPWLEHRSDEVFGSVVTTPGGTQIRSLRFDEVRGAVGPEVIVDTVVFLSA